MSKPNKHLTKRELDNDIKKFQSMLRPLSGKDIKSVDDGPRSIGDTLERALGKQLDNKQKPDFFNAIELKSHDELSNTPTTLFTKSPKKINGKSANSMIRKQFGFPDKNVPNVKVFYYKGKEQPHDCIRSHHRFRIINSKDDLKLVNDDPHKTSKVIAIWSKKSLEDAWNRKTRHDGIVVVVDATKKPKNGQMYFRYNSVRILGNLTVNDFLRSLDNHDSQTFVDIRIGVYSKKGTKTYGKKHDHGTGFRMSLKTLAAHTLPTPI